jgi:hypothetical protein
MQEKIIKNKNPIKIHLEKTKIIIGVSADYLKMALFVTVPIRLQI